MNEFSRAGAIFTTGMLVLAFFSHAIGETEYVFWLVFLFIYGLLGTGGSIISDYHHE